MQARPRSQKFRDALAENQLSIPIDRPQPNFGFEIQSQGRSRSAFRSTPRVRPADVSAEKTRATVAEVIRPACRADKDFSVHRSTKSRRRQKQTRLAILRRADARENGCGGWI